MGAANASVETVGIGLLGRGTVGGAFHDLVTGGADEIARVCGRRPEIVGVLRRNEGDFEQILAGSEVIVELMGGTDPALDYVSRALKSGRHVITANKQLLAKHGEELFALARENGVQLRFEAAVAGVVPAIRVISESLAATEISRVFGIVNGTTNFILSEMAATGADYGETLARAQELGYAEADPTDDVSGADAAAKMALLARLAFHTAVSIDDVEYEGIEGIKPEDLAYAKEFGLSLKLLGVAERRDDGVSVRVFPCFLYGGHPLSPVSGPFNAVTVEAPTITEITMSGPGAGGPETATAVLGDLLSVVGGEARLREADADLPIVNNHSSAFYLHVGVFDKPRVLAQIAEVLGRHEISVRSVAQRGAGADTALVMVVHECPERKFFEALDEIAELDVVWTRPRALRVIEEEFTA